MNVFDDFYSAKAPSSSVFDGSLARNGVPGDLSSEGLVLLARRARFLSYVHSVWQVWHLWDILRSKALFCLTGAGHRAHFCPCGRRGAFLRVAKTVAGVA